MIAVYHRWLPVFPSKMVVDVVGWVLVDLDLLYDDDCLSRSLLHDSRNARPNSVPYGQFRNEGETRSKSSSATFRSSKLDYFAMNAESRRRIEEDESSPRNVKLSLLTLKKWWGTAVCGSDLFL